MVLKHKRSKMKYYSQYRSHDLFELQELLSGLSKSNRWVKLADHLPWDRIEKEYNKRLRNSHNGAGNDHGGTMKIDATCCNAEVRYPTDSNRLEDGSRLIDRLLDKFCVHHKVKKQQTHRTEARQAFIGLSKKKRKRTDDFAVLITERSTP